GREVDEAEEGWRTPPFRFTSLEGRRSLASPRRAVGPSAHSRIDTFVPAWCGRGMALFPAPGSESVRRLGMALCLMMAATTAWPGEAPAMARVRVAPDGEGFVLAGSGE